MQNMDLPLPVPASPRVRAWPSSHLPDQKPALTAASPSISLRKTQAKSRSNILHVDFWDRFMNPHCVHGPFHPILHQYCPLQRIRVLKLKQMKSSPAEVSTWYTE